jgi:CheY-like chemotaxis protein
MPVINGYDATKKMRSLPVAWAASVPVISVSADSSADLPEKCREAGISDYIPKPVTMEALYETIVKWIN